MSKKEITTITIKGREYARAIDIAKDKGYRSGKVLCNQYTDDIEKVWGIDFLPCDLFYEATTSSEGFTIDFAFEKIRAMSANDMNEHKIRRFITKEGKEDMEVVTRNKTTYRTYQNRIERQLRNSGKVTDEIYKEIDFSKCIKIEEIVYLKAYAFNGVLEPLDSDNVAKALGDSVFKGLRNILGLEKLDDKIISDHRCIVRMVQSGEEEKIVVKITNDEGATDYDCFVRCKELAEELEDKNKIK